MVEERKLTWKGKNLVNPISLFVGKVINVITSSYGIQIKLEGRNLINGTNHTLLLSEIETNINYSVSILKNLNHIEEGDILLVKENNIRSLFRKNSNNNSIFATIRCNSNCLMCSQPPLDIDDTKENYIIWDYAIELMPEELEFIGFTGGEPTLLEEYLILLINKLLIRYPNIIIDILSNGRLQATNDYCKVLEKIIDPKRVVFAIPLYSDIYNIHDYIVQSKDAFYQTILGIHNMAELGFLIEIRVVLHKISIERLEELAKYIHKNFPFIYHITFMGLEIIGYTKANKDVLIIDDINHTNQILEKAVLYLDKWNYNTSIYNTPLCHLPTNLRKYAKQSISDWKNSFHNECTSCLLKSECAGFFSWNIKNSHVKPITEVEV
ncbi:His-Xaa-Ser system radical SAM maturase HxsC [Joostella sp.]|uniref:His-Xaa-Ser system radical SAM maturase HxsC n=1 Tax=Joostella sp. TaxID=2231138 RepID=UPI003A947BB9